MQSKVLLKVPSSYLANSYLIREEEIELDLRLSFPERIRSFPFFYDLLYRIEDGGKKEAPWIFWEENIHSVLGCWKEVERDIQESFQSKDKSLINKKMVEGISLFLVTLHWLNERPVKSLEIPTSYPFQFKPVNVEERLLFCMSHITLFHSYRQLKELFSELEKIYYKKRVIQKKKTWKRCEIFLAPF